MTSTRLVPVWRLIGYGDDAVGISTVVTLSSLGAVEREHWSRGDPCGGVFAYAGAPMAPPKRKSGGGRVTPKGTQPGAGRSAPKGTGSSRDGDESYEASHREVAASSRYTPKAKRGGMIPPNWIPIIMVALLVGGGLAIMARYLI